ncbi:hypothetical protein B9479_006167 [Cryptococcus floricola]|uniref:Thioredoxin domain-containing protein n=1 Tax=Cryptococcus floricola TaxID=2591691 RepID=A0A5D3ASI8_9TREE|nr:hypothetical protein B9479_006167 [Cryptococcus floricola]
MEFFGREGVKTKGKKPLAEKSRDREFGAAFGQKVSPIFVLSSIFLLLNYIYRNASPDLSDCVAVESTVRDAFDGPAKPNAAVYWVGKIQEWRTANNKARVDWNVNNIPTIVRFDNGKETARLVEDEILDKSKLQAFLK